VFVAKHLPQLTEGGTGVNLCGAFYQNSSCFHYADAIGLQDSLQPMGNYDDRRRAKRCLHNTSNNFVRPIELKLIKNQNLVKEGRINAGVCGIRNLFSSNAKPP